MRLRIGWLFALALALAACGGGGKSSVLPVTPQASAPVPARKSTRALAVVLNVPPAAQQARSKRPFYISENTKSIVFAVVPNGSGTPVPAEEQVFPVATPSPCATTGSGGETCSFSVVAPYGNDIFYVATFAVASPSASTLPLSSFESGTIAVGSPGPSPTPLAFTMNGVVSTVAITVPSPDPSNTPNTQVFTAAVPTAVPLGITPYDASGAAILSDSFAGAITINVTPANSGVGLTLSPTCSTSSGSATPAPTIAIGCASDLGSATVVYGGKVTADSSDHIIDTFSISTTQLVSPSPSPATVVLASNVTTYEPTSTSYPQAYLQALPNNVIAFMIGGSGFTTAAYGTIDVSTGTPSALLTLNGVTPSAFFTMSDGSMWVPDNNTDELDCFSAGGTLQTPQISLASYMLAPDDVTFDGTQIWVTGYTGSSAVVVHATLTASCQIGAVSSTTLPNEIYGDVDLLMAPQTAGGVLIDGAGTGGAWSVTSSGAATYLNPGFTAGTGFGSGVAIDGTGTGYFGFYNDECSTCNPLFTLASGGSSLSNVAAVSYPGGTFGALAAFGPNGGAADRLALADTSHDVLAFVEGPNGSTPVTIPITLSNAYYRGGRNVAFSTKGAGFTSFEDQSSEQMAIARIYLTTTWAVPQTALQYDDLLSIDERGDSGSFTLTPISPPSCYSGYSAVPGTDHAFYLGNSTVSPCTVTLQIADRNKRSQTVTVTIPGAD